MLKCPECGNQFDDLEKTCSCGYNFWSGFSNEEKQTFYLREISKVLKFFFFLTIFELVAAVIWLIYMFG